MRSSGWPRLSLPDGRRVDELPSLYVGGAAGYRSVKQSSHQPCTREAGGFFDFFKWFTFKEGEVQKRVQSIRSRAEFLRNSATVSVNDRIPFVTEIRAPYKIGNGYWAGSVTAALKSCPYLLNSNGTRLQERLEPHIHSSARTRSMEPNMEIL